MADIKISKGLNIPISGQPLGSIKFLRANEHSFSSELPKQIALDLKSFEEIKFKLLVEVGDQVKIGQPLAEDKSLPGRFFVSPAGGVVSDIRRGLKRRLLAIVIDVAEKEEYKDYPIINPETTSREDIIKQLLDGGIFTHIQRRPFAILANPGDTPRSIFVKAIESAPFTPPSEMQVMGQEKEFQAGLDALSKLTNGSVHLVYSSKSTSSAFINAQNVTKHTAEGPHPIGTHSIHIQKIDPIRSVDDVVWTLNAHDVVLIGNLLINGRYYTERVISIAGPGIIEERAGYYRVREGIPINSLIQGRLPEGAFRLISGDPLTGSHVEQQDFLGFNDFVFCAISENEEREFLHFFRLGKDKYSMSRAYLSGHLDNKNRQYDFNTSLHGGSRPFIVASMYDKVQPLNISTMLLVKAVMAEDFELAESYGLLEVDSEDFALATFVCPSKIEMTDIIHQGLKQYSKEVLA
jgi:Na+-transporting NADH:ubiquinone oxidoreductase subunit A